MLVPSTSTNQGKKAKIKLAGKPGARYVVLFYFLLVMIFTPVLSHATDIRGRVDRMNPLTNKPVPYPNVRVTLWKNNKRIQQTRTGRNGLYYMKNLSQGQYALQVGKQPRIQITIRSDRSQDIRPILVRK